PQPHQLLGQDRRLPDLLQLRGRTFLSLQPSGSLAQLRCIPAAAPASRPGPANKKSTWKIQMLFTLSHFL
uniref:hypothetical protein n=1 Tax=Bacillus siamensis TaxID=659243 RepID=UPI003D81B184